MVLSFWVGIKIPTILALISTPTESWRCSNFHILSKEEFEQHLGQLHGEFQAVESIRICPQTETYISLTGSSSTEKTLFSSRNLPFSNSHSIQRCTENCYSFGLESLGIEIETQPPLQRDVDKKATLALHLPRQWLLRTVLSVILMHPPVLLLRPPTIESKAPKTEKVATACLLILVYNWSHF